MIPFIVGIFALVQIFFVMMDLAVVWRRGGAPDWREIWDGHRHAILAIAAFWLGYFILQTAGVALIPGLNDAATFLRSHLGYPASPSRIGAAEILAVCALQVWTYVAVSFWDYTTHRWILHHRWFWVFHEYHHLPRQVFNGMPGISARPFVFVTTLFTYAGSLLFLWLPLRYLVSPDTGSLYVLSIPFTILVLTLVLSVGHSIWLRQFPRVHHALKFFGIATPQEHVLHHSNHRRVNYGNFSCVWGRLFGTYLDPAECDLDAEPLGLPYDQDFLGALCLGRVKIPRRLRENCGLEAFCHFD